jgi:effector-binding domain-containing protein
MKGSYMQHGDAFMQLGTQLQAQGKEPVGPPFSRYFNSMREVAEAELLWEVGFPVGTDVKATAPLELKDIPGGLCATLAYQGAPDGIEPAMTGVVTWVTANGYRPAGTLTMLFLGEPGPSGMQVELRLPVEKTK